MYQLIPMNCRYGYRMFDKPTPKCFQTVSSNEASIYMLTMINKKWNEYDTICYLINKIISFTEVDKIFGLIKQISFAYRYYNFPRRIEFSCSQYATYHIDESKIIVVLIQNNSRKEKVKFYSTLICHQIPPIPNPPGWQSSYQDQCYFHAQLSSRPQLLNQRIP